MFQIMEMSELNKKANRIRRDKNRPESSIVCMPPLRVSVCQDGAVRKIDIKQGSSVHSTFTTQSRTLWSDIEFCILWWNYMAVRRHVHRVCYRHADRETSPILQLSLL